MVKLRLIKERRGQVTSYESYDSFKWYDSLTRILLSKGSSKTINISFTKTAGK